MSCAYCNIKAARKPEQQIVHDGWQRRESVIQTQASVCHAGTCGMIIAMRCTTAFCTRLISVRYSLELCDRAAISWSRSSRRITLLAALRGSASITDTPCTLNSGFVCCSQRSLAALLHYSHAA